jgi:hypothetical protein
LIRFHFNFHLFAWNPGFFRVTLTLLLLLLNFFRHSVLSWF